MIDQKLQEALVTLGLTPRFQVAEEDLLALQEWAQGAAQYVERSRQPEESFMDAVDRMKDSLLKQAQEKVPRCDLPTLRMLLFIHGSQSETPELMARLR